ncbi:peptidase inhibitor family I36 protein [Streptomyces sp. NPDC038707]|uniref:peptidase inhibitor family I36 protein n=1 Tax=Streptomyces sp. NPDC038707 TaxID=3154329 RepID=UPI0033E66F4F
MRIRTMLTIAAVGSMALTGIAVVPSLAADEPGSVPEVLSDVLTPEEEAQVHADADPTDKVDMYYNSEKVDPASDWNGADICAEVSEDGTMQCFDSNTEANKFLAVHAPTAEARAGAKRALAAKPAASATQGVTMMSTQEVTIQKYQDCPSNWVCLWQDSNYSGRRLQWPTYDTAKTRHLDQYSPSFRDKATSAFINRPQRGVELYDFRTAMPDPHLFLGAGYSLYSNFKNIDYPYGGSWNDRADAIKF